MTVEQKALILLLRSSLCREDAAACPEADWQSVFSEARLQTVTALAYEKLPVSVPAGIRESWKNTAYSQKANYVRYLSAQDALLELLSAHSVPAAVLKGSAASVYYPVPSLRTMGDIDLIVPSGHFDRAVGVITEAGYARMSDEDDAENRRRHVSFEKDGFVFEVHHHFSYVGLDIDAYTDRGLSDIRYGETDGHVFPMLPPLPNGIVLLTHMREHLRCGLGLRQLIDWMMFVSAELDDSFWDDGFGAAVKSRGLEGLAVTATRLRQIYLGLTDSVTWCSGADEGICAVMLECILSSGNFGNMDSAGNMVDGVMANIRKEGLFPYLQRIGERDWKLYHRHRILRPFAWLYESCVFLKTGLTLRRGGKDLVSRVSGSRDRYELLERLGLI